MHLKGSVDKCIPQSTFDKAQATLTQRETPFIFTMHGHMLLVAALVAFATALPIDDVSPGEHIQHVTMPPLYTTTESNSRIQRVLPRRITQSESTKTNPSPPTDETWAELSEPATTGTSADEITTDISFTAEGHTVVDPQPRGNPDMPDDDLATANFFWGFGLGPVYPHLYQFKRVPHLVPIHSWNPYHDYYVYHQKYPNVYKI